jgi:hypothetical protein
MGKIIEMRDPATLLHADEGLWYNRPVNIVVAGGACDTPARIHLDWRYIMDMLPPHAQKGNTPFVTIPMNLGYSVIVDREDADLAQWKWYASKDGYAIRQVNSSGRVTSVRMHRAILERKLGHPLQSKIHVDHINGNPRDNRRENLREVTVSQNLANQKKEHRKKASVSQFKGVASRKGKWQASISFQGYRHYLGVFDTPELAAQVYDQAALELYGEYAATNGTPAHPSLQSVIRKPGQIKTKNESGFRGVWKDNSANWVAKITVKGKTIRLGTFVDKAEAAHAYDRAVIAIKGKNALTNFPLEEYDAEDECFQK